MSIPDHNEAGPARRGHELYEREIRAAIDEVKDRGKMLVINVETGEYEMDGDDVAAAKRAKARFGNAALFAMRVGHPAAYRIGGRSLAGNP